MIPVFDFRNLRSVANVFNHSWETLNIHWRVCTSADITHTITNKLTVKVAAVNKFCIHLTQHDDKRY